MSSQLDLSQLALDRTEPGNESRPGNRYRWLLRYALPGGILLGFATLVVVATGLSLWPRPVVEVVPVVVQRNAASVSANETELFQAAGWIEPRPTPINVPALAPGVIEELLVVEGQQVKRDQPIARLISIDAEIALKQTEAALATAEAGLERAIAERRAAEIRLNQPVHLHAQLADARSLLARTRGELASLPFQIESAQAAIEYAQKSVEGKRNAGTAVPGLVLKKAESDRATARAQLRELQQRQPLLTEEVDALAAKVQALETQLELLVDETQQLQEAEAKLLSARAELDAAKLRRQQASLELARNTIRAPIDGRILSLLAAPGTRVVGLSADARQDSSSVVAMYDPQLLQVRADVRLEHVPLVQPGQPVQIETASASEPIRGRVLQTSSVANIQKNTLEVKVELLEPPPTVRPEMLVTATFLSVPNPTADSIESPASTRLLVPKRLVQESPSGQFVWVVDADQFARKKNVALGEIAEGDLVEVVSGLQLTDKLIASAGDGLRDGAAVKIATGKIDIN